MKHVAQRDDRAFTALAAMLKDAAERLPTLRVVDSIVVTHRDWTHGEARCPACGLHLDPARDLDERITALDSTRPVGVRATHRRCGASFVFTFEEGKP